MPARAPFSSAAIILLAGSAAAIAAGPFGEVIELSTLNGADGFVLNGAGFYASSGYAVSSAGDINGDGVDDLIIGAYGASPNGTASGQTYVVFGATDVGAGGSIELSALNGTNGFALDGIYDVDRSGVSVSCAGDVNGDGIDDLIIGARGADPNSFNSGESYVVFGGSTVGAAGSVELSSLNGANGFIVTGPNAGDICGSSVSSAGDVNGDGVDDLIIGAHGADPNGLYSGQSYVIFGGSHTGEEGTIDPSTFDGEEGFVINGVNAYDRVGRSVSSAGDVNRDGFDDLIIGAEGVETNGNFAGASYIIFGAPDVGMGGTIEIASINGANGFVINGVDVNDSSGRSVSSAGDVNGDGFHDLLIGAYKAQPNGPDSGECYVVFGGPAVGAAGTIELAALDGDDGFVLEGIEQDDLCGVSVSPAGDVNCDGIDDFLIGAPGADPNGSYDGESYVVFGKPSQFWSNPAGGDFDTASNWLCNATPIAGYVVINPAIGVTVNGPPGALFVSTLVLDADLGRTTLDMQAGSLISVERDFTISSSAALVGEGTFVAESAFTNDGLIEPTALALVAAQGITNSGDITLETFGPTTTPERLTVFGALTNETGAHITARGAASIEFADGVTNSGSLSVAFAQATVTGPLTNVGTDDGMGGFDPLGVISVSGGSEALLSGDILNQSNIFVTPDSTLSILGSLTGNGVSGPDGMAGTVFIEGDFNPGFALSTSITCFEGDLTISARSDTSISIGGTSAGAQHDQVISTTSVTAAGDLRIELVGDFAPSRGDTFTIISAPAVNTSFNTFTAPPLPDPLVWRLIEEPTHTRVLVTVAADLNSDGVVSANDLATLINNWGPCPASPTPCKADLDGDGTIGASDLARIIGRWGS